MSENIYEIIKNRKHKKVVRLTEPEFMDFITRLKNEHFDRADYSELNEVQQVVYDLVYLDDLLYEVEIVEEYIENSEKLMHTLFRLEAFFKESAFINTRNIVNKLIELLPYPAVTHWEVFTSESIVYGIWDIVNMIKNKPDETLYTVLISYLRKSNNAELLFENVKEDD